MITDALTQGPAFTLSVDGTDITGTVAERLISLALRDQRGLEADELSFELDDADGLLAIPPKGAEVRLAIGWPGNLVDKGSFYVDTVRHTGPPDALAVSAKSADLGEKAKTAKERSFHDTTLGAILQTIAGDQGLTAVVSEDLAGVSVDHLDQTNESDAHLLTRLGQRYGAVATVKDGRLLFTAAGTGRTASGQAMGGVTIDRSEGDAHTYQEASRDAEHTGVKAYWDDKQAAERKHVIFGEEGTVRTLRDPYPDQDQAEAAAQGELKRLKRTAATMTLNLAVGRAELLPETRVTLTGWKEQITAHAWLITQVVHQIDGNGYTCDLDLEEADADEAQGGW